MSDAVQANVAQPPVASAATPYVVANDDAAFPTPTGVSFYRIAANGRLVFQEQVITGGFGAGGGFFLRNRRPALA